MSARAMPPPALPAVPVDYAAVLPECVRVVVQAIGRQPFIASPLTTRVHLWEAVDAVAELVINGHNIGEPHLHTPAESLRFLLEARAAGTLPRRWVRAIAVIPANRKD